MKFHATRIQHLAEKAPYRVVEENGQLYATTIGGESVHEMLGAVDALTEDWAEANGFTYDNSIASPEVACHPGSGYVEGLKLPKGWVTS